MVVFGTVNTCIYVCMSVCSADEADAALCCYTAAVVVVVVAVAACCCCCSSSYTYHPRLF